MNRRFGTVFVAALLAGIAAGSARPLPSPEPRFHPPILIRAGDIAFPPDVMELGMVSLVLSLDDYGRVQNIQALREVRALTGVVEAAVRSWKFEAATLNGNPVPANVSVSAVFNPYNPDKTSFDRLSLTPPSSAPASPAGSPAFIPPQIASAAFAAYPPQSVAWGTVVLNVTIAPSGQVKRVHAVKSVPALTSAAETAVKSWSFRPATLDGRPVSAECVIAFVFPQNIGRP